MAGVTSYRRSPAVDETVVDDRVVLYHRVSGAAIVLNPTASILWKELSTDRNCGALEQTLIDRFPRVERSRIEADVRLCLVDLASHQLISAQRDESSPLE